MKLFKALKIKNRLVGELNLLRTAVRRDNVAWIRTTADNETRGKRAADPKGILDKIAEKTTELIALKTAICKANVGIYHKISRMAECKASIDFLEGLRFAGDDDVHSDYTGKTVWVTRHEDVFYSKEAACAEIERLRKEIERLQDDVDEYNAVTEVDI